MDKEQQKLAEEFLFSGKGKPSFAKLFFFGVYDVPKVFPFPKVKKKEQIQTEELVLQVRKFAQKQINADEIDRRSQIPDKILRGLGKLGVLGLTIPKRYGGLGMSQYAYCKVVEELASHCGSTALFVNAHQSVGLKALLLFGTSKQKAKWLEPLSRGKQFAAFSLTEPNAGSDASAIETTATYDPKKKIYRLKGNKQWTTNGSIAEVLTVMAKTEDGKITAFLVTPNMRGFRVKDKALEKVGMRGTWTSNLIFDGVEVPQENILGPKGKGLRVCLTVLDYGRTTFGAACTGSARTLVEKAVSYANSRYQFGKPLSHFPLVKKKLALITSLHYAMEATTYLTAGLLDAGEKDIMLEAAMLKVFASESLWKIIYETMQIYGGKSFFTDEPLERMMRDARLNMIGEGANEVLKAFISAVGMRDVGMQLKKGVESAKHIFENPKEFWNFSKSLINRLRTPEHPFRSKQAKRLAKIVQRFGKEIVKVLAKYGEEIVDKQLILERFTSVAIAIYTTTAVMARLESNPDSNMKEKMTAGYYCNYALDMAERSFRGLNKNRDNELEQLSDVWSKEYENT